MLKFTVELTWNICTPLVEIAKNTLLHMDNAHPWVCFGCDLFNRNLYKWDLCTTPASWRNMVCAQALDIPLWPLCRVHNVCFTLCSLILYTCNKHVWWIKRRLNDIFSNAKYIQISKGITRFINRKYL